VQDSQLLDYTFQQPSLFLTRHIELGDLVLGYEQARQLALVTPAGQPLLVLAEAEANWLSGFFLRQIFDASRAFTFDVFSSAQQSDAPPQGALHL
jgi:Scramblase